MERNVTVGLVSGLHARPAALLVQEAKQFTSEVFIQSGTQKVSVRSIMGLMSLALTKGSEVRIIAEGEDAQEAVSALEAFLSSEEPVST